MIARTLTVDVGSDRLDDVLDAYRQHVRPIHERADGLRLHLVLADRAAGRVGIIGVWDSEASLAAVADELEPARERLWASFERSPTLEVYEVADTLGPI